MFFQDNSIGQELQSLIQLQREQLMEIKQLNNQARMSRLGQPNTQITPPSNISFTPYAAYSIEADAPVGFSPTTQSMFDQANQYMHSGVGFKHLVFQDPMRINKMNRDLMAMHYGNKVTNVGVAGAGGVASAVGDIAGTAVFGGMGVGLLGSIVAGIGAGALVGKTVDVGMDNIKQYQEMNRYLFRNSYRFIDRSESNNQKYGVGFSADERQDITDYLRHLNTDKFLKDDEIQKMMMDFTEYDLMRTVSDTKSFKDRMSKLVDATKESALMLNETYDQITQLMGDFQKAGMDGTKFSTFAAMARNTAFHTGQDPSQAARNIFNLTQNMVRGTGVNMENEYQDMALTMSLVGDIRKEAELGMSNQNLGEGERERYSKIYSWIENNGGIMGATQLASQMLPGLITGDELYRTLAGYGFYRDEQGGLMKDDAKFNELLEAFRNNDSEKLSQIYKVVKERGSNFLLSWQQNADTAIANLDLVDQATMFNVIDRFGRNRTGQSMMDLTMLRGQGYTEEQIMFMQELLQEATPKSREKYIAESFWEEKRGEMEAKKAGVFKRIKNWLGEITDEIGDPFAGIAQSIDETMVGITEWWSGVDYSKFLNYGNFEYSEEARQKYMSSFNTDIAGGLANAAGKFSELGIDGNVNWVDNSLISHSVSAEDFYANLTSQNVGVVKKDIDKRIRDLQKVMRGMSSASPEFKAATKILHKLSESKKGVENLENRAIQSGAAGVLAIDIFDGLQGKEADIYEDFRKEMTKMVDVQRNTVDLVDIDDLSKWEQENKNKVIEFLSAIKSSGGDKSITDILNDNEFTRNFVNISNLDSEPGWSQSELEKLAEKIMAMSTTGNSPDDVQATPVDKGKMKEALEENSELLNQVLEKMEKDNTRLKDFILNAL